MTVHYITVYTLQPEAMASILSELLLPFDSLKKHLQRKGFWKDTHEIGGYDGYALINHYLYGFKATPYTRPGHTNTQLSGQWHQGV